MNAHGRKMWMDYHKKQAAKCRADAAARQARYDRDVAWNLAAEWSGLDLLNVDSEIHEILMQSHLRAAEYFDSVSISEGED